MNVLIQHPTTREYLDQDIRWTTLLSEAADFRFAASAIYCGVNRLKQPFLILFKFDQSQWDFTSHAFAEYPRL